MIDFKIDLQIPIINMRKVIDDELEKEVYPFLRNTANTLLDQRIKEKGEEPYTITVDGRNVASRAYISQAKKRVTIHFIQDVVNIGMAEIAATMSRNISDFASPKEWIQRDKIAAMSMIRIIYYNRQKNISSPISNSAEITDFRPGDKIYLVPIFGTQMYSNVKNPDPDKKGSKGWGEAKGWMGKTAANIRGRLRIGKRNSPIRVIAGRSRAALDYIPLVKRPNGSYIKRTAEDTKRGAWVIIIEYSNVRI